MEVSRNKEDGCEGVRGIEYLPTSEVVVAGGPGADVALRCQN